MSTDTISSPTLGEGTTGGRAAATERPVTFDLTAPATYLSGGPGRASRRRRPFHRMTVSSQAIRASRTITLAPEPEGDRSGVVRADGVDASSPAITLSAVGDSMVAGCGTGNQSLGLIPKIALFLSQATGRPVAWATDAKLGATIRRVRYRQLPTFTAEGRRSDLIFIGAGSNDIMARRGTDEWGSDLAACIDEAKRHAAHVMVMSCGQLQMIPSLGVTLRRDLERLCDEQVKVSQRVCDEHGAALLNLVHADLGCENAWFWCADRFHPNVEGYTVLARYCVASLPASVISSLAAGASPASA